MHIAFTVNTKTMFSDAKEILVVVLTVFVHFFKQKCQERILNLQF